MREGWVEKRLKDVAFVFAGQSAPQKQEDYSLTGTPFIKAGNLSELISGKNEDSILKVTDFAVEKYGLKKYKSGSVLFAKSGMSCLKGYVYVTKNDCYVVSHLAIVQPKEDVNSYYLKYHFMYHKPYLLAKDTAYPSISIADILNYKIILPKIEKQEQIASELDMITEMISKYDEQLKELDKLSQSIFYEMFGDPVENEKGWEVKKIVEIADATIGLTYKPENVADNGVIVLRSGNIKNSALDFTDILRVETNIPSHKYVKDGDILMCTRNGSLRHVGKVAIIKNLNEQMTYGAFMTVIRSEMNPYLYGYFNTPAFRDSLIHGKTTTINQITVKMLNETSLPIPPLPLQQSFARKIEAIEAMKSKVREAKKEAETLLAARMQYWFE